MPRVAFRADASSLIGTGHVRRCGALAAALLDLAAEVLLVDRDHGLPTGEMLDARIGRVRLPPPDGLPPASDVPHAAWAGVGQAEDAKAFIAAAKDFAPDWVVVDHYAFDAHWHDLVRVALGCNILVIDDLADRNLSADLIVDHNLRTDTPAFYRQCLTRPAKILGGPRFALLGPAFAKAPRYAFNDDVRSIGIFMGGSDFLGMSGLALDAIAAAGFTGPVEIATTSANPVLEALTSHAAARPETRLSVDLPDLAAFFARHDLQIGAGGGAMLERCCIGAPTIAIPWAENQVEVLAHLASKGAVKILAPNALKTAPEVIRALCGAGSERSALSEASKTLVDGRGAKRIALSVLPFTLRAATSADAKAAFRWRNDLRTRAYFRDAAQIDEEEHIAWWSGSLSQNERALFMAIAGNLSVGVSRLDFEGDACEISVYTDPDLQGMGIGSSMIDETANWVSVNRSEVRQINAFVKAENFASIAAFNRCGFEGAGPWLQRQIPS